MTEIHLIFIFLGPVACIFLIIGFGLGARFKFKEDEKELEDEK